MRVRCSDKVKKTDTLIGYDISCLVELTDLEEFAIQRVAAGHDRFYYIILSELDIIGKYSRNG